MQLSRFQHTGTVPPPICNRYRTYIKLQCKAQQPTPQITKLVTIIAMLRCCRLCWSAGNKTGSGDTGSGTTSGPGFDTGGAGGNRSRSFQPFEGPQTRGGFGPGFSRLKGIWKKEIKVNLIGKHVWQKKVCVPYILHCNFVDPDRVGSASFCRIRIRINSKQMKLWKSRVTFFPEFQYAVQNTKKLRHIWHRSER